jgi:hypothetical protein
MNRTLLLIAVSILSAGCAGGPARMKDEAGYERYRPYLGSPVTQFTAFHFDSWEVASANQVVIWTNPGEAYLITVWDTCRDLNFVQHIGLTSTGYSVSKSESLRVGQQTCPIESIRPIDVHRFKEDRAALHEAK